MFETSIQWLWAVKGTSNKNLSRCCLRKMMRRTHFPKTLPETNIFPWKPMVGRWIFLLGCPNFKKILLTLLKTKSHSTWHEAGHQKETHLNQPQCFRCDLLVSGRVLSRSWDHESLPSSRELPHIFPHKRWHKNWVQWFSQLPVNAGICFLVSWRVNLKISYNHWNLRGHPPNATPQETTY